MKHPVSAIVSQRMEARFLARLLEAAGFRATARGNRISYTGGRNERSYLVVVHDITDKDKP